MQTACYIFAKLFLTKLATLQYVLTNLEKRRYPYDPTLLLRSIFLDSLLHVCLKRQTTYWHSKLFCSIHKWLCSAVKYNNCDDEKSTTFNAAKILFSFFHFLFFDIIMRKRKSNNDTTVALDDDCNEEEELEKKKAASVDSGQDYLSVDPITAWS